MASQTDFCVPAQGCKLVNKQAKLELFTSRGWTKLICCRTFLILHKNIFPFRMIHKYYSLGPTQLLTFGLGTEIKKNNEKGRKSG